MLILSPTAVPAGWVLGYPPVVTRALHRCQIRILSINKV